MPSGAPNDRGNGGAGNIRQNGQVTEMNDGRTVLTDAMRARTGHMLPGRKSDPGVTAADSRLSVGAALWRTRTGTPWRGLPERSGKCGSVFRRFRRWAPAGVSGRVSEALPESFHLECVSVDGTAVQAHRKAPGAEGETCGQGTGRSRGGLTGKAVAVTDALGFLVRSVILPGRPHGPVGVPDLTGYPAFGALVGDKAFDADRLPEEVAGRGAKGAIPSKANRKELREHGTEMYRRRHRIDSFSPKPKSSGRLRRGITGRPGASQRRSAWYRG